MKKRKGFTLVELLIVVVILAILASMIVPRFLAQPEKAVLAEANTMLGAIARAQNTTIDSGVGTAWLALTQATAADWTAIGMTMPATSKNWVYACTAATSCTATRTATGGTTYNGKVLTVSAAGAWTCASPYAESTTGGCKLA